MTALSRRITTIKLPSVSFSDIFLKGKDFYSPLLSNGFVSSFISPCDAGRSTDFPICRFLASSHPRATMNSRPPMHISAAETHFAARKPIRTSLTVLAVEASIVTVLLKYMMGRITFLTPAICGMFFAGLMLRFN